MALRAYPGYQRVFFSRAAGTLFRPKAKPTQTSPKPKTAHKKSMATRLFRASFLKGHCHGDIAIFSSKWLKYLTKNLFSNKKFLLEHQEGNIKEFFRGRTNYKHFLMTSLEIHKRNFKNLANFFKLQSISILAIPSQR